MSAIPRITFLLKIPVHILRRLIEAMSLEAANNLQGRPARRSGRFGQNQENVDIGTFVELGRGNLYPTSG